MEARPVPWQEGSCCVHLEKRRPRILLVSAAMFGVPREAADQVPAALPDGLFVT
jgi:hypothetical protein